jgi:hypothetical protein
MQGDRQQQHRRLQGLEVVPLRRHGDQASASAVIDATSMDVDDGTGAATGWKNPRARHTR